jgi:hypothetical protein
MVEHVSSPAAMVMQAATIPAHRQGHNAKPAFVTPSHLREFVITGRCDRIFSAFSDG